MANREIVFESMSGSLVSGRELHVTLHDDNHIDWQVVPVGEHGQSMPFDNPEEAERFVQSYAYRLGFTIRPEAAISAKLPT